MSRCVIWKKFLHALFFLGVFSLGADLEAHSEPKSPQFLWGAGFSAHQVEGGDDHSDWWDWEHKPGKIARNETTALATDHYHRFSEDFQWARDLELNTVRLSVAWSRIEPEPGLWSSSELQHYRDVIQDLRIRGLEPVVTLHHFTHPKWFHEAGGWAHPESPRWFARFVERVVGALGSDVSIWITFNEPMVFLIEGYLKGNYPPGIKSFDTAVLVFENLVRAHGLASQAIRRLDPLSKDGAISGVGLALNAHVFDPVNSPKTSAGKKDLQAIAQLSDLYFWAFLRAAQTGVLEWEIPSIPALKKGYRFKKKIPEAEHSLDWIGINYYTRYLIERDPRNSLGIRWVDPSGGLIFPEGTGRVMKEAHAHLVDRIPMVMSENGLSDPKDEQRTDFITRSLRSLWDAKKEGLDVRGYWHWSLTDNFEWNWGYEPRFGLIAIDYASLRRTPRASAFHYRNQIREYSMK